jgi:hypothetical protein
MLKIFQKKRNFAVLIFTLISVALLTLKALYPPGFISTDLRLLVFLLPELVFLFLTLLVLYNFQKFINIFLFYIFLFAGLYFIEYMFYVLANNNHNNKSYLIESAATRSGAEYDTRSIKEVLQSDKDKGLNSVISVSPANWSKNQDIYPLSGISKRATIYCREESQYVRYVSDRYGFRNQDYKWDQKQSVVLIGDSFTQGGCVNNKNNISGELEKNGISNLNLGWGGTSIVIQSAILKEYSHLINSNNVVLFFYPKNDFLEFRSERKNNLLTNYKNKDGYIQNLSEKQESIDKMIEKYISNWEKTDNHNNYKIYQFSELFNMTVKILRQYLSVDVRGNYFIYLKDLDQYLNGQGKSLMVTCIPSYSDFMNQEGQNSCLENEKYFKDIGVDYFNPFESIKGVKLEELYPYGVNAHFSNSGYKIYVESILSYIRMFVDREDNKS